MNPPLELFVDVRAKALLFDMDGTLVDTMPSHYRAWQEIGRMHGFSFTPEQFSCFAGTPSSRFVEICNREFGLRLDVVATVNAKNELYGNYLDRMRPIEPVFSIAKRYHGRLPLAIGTSENRIVAQRVIEAAGLSPWFRTVVTVDEAGTHKPDPEIFLLCARLLGVDPRDRQVFEDSDIGLEAARRAGMIPTDVREFVNRQELLPL